MNAFVYLALAISLEVGATVALKASHGFSRLVPSIIAVVGYCLTFLFLSLALRHIPLGFVYALWSGVGTVALVLLSAWLYRENINTTSLAGVLLIVIGVVVLNLSGGGHGQAADHPVPNSARHEDARSISGPIPG